MRIHCSGEFNYRSNGIASHPKDSRLKVTQTDDMELCEGGPMHVVDVHGARGS